MMEDEDEGGEDAMRAKATVFAAAMALLLMVASLLLVALLRGVIGRGMGSPA